MEPIHRSALLDATISEVGKVGTLDITVSQMAKCHGMSSRLAHLYFVATEKIFLAAMRHTLALYAWQWKHSRCNSDPEQLFTFKANPHERSNLAIDPIHHDGLGCLSAYTHAPWGLDTFDAEVRESKARCPVVYSALRQGGYYPWVYQPLQKVSELNLRNHMDLKK